MLLRKKEGKMESAEKAVSRVESELDRFMDMLTRNSLDNQPPIINREMLKQAFLIRGELAGISVALQEIASKP